MWKSAEKVTSIDPNELMKLDYVRQPQLKPPVKSWVDSYDFSLDGFAAVGIPRPKTEEEKKAMVDKFLSGLEKELTAEGNWTFLREVLLTLDFCERCGACADACHVYLASSKNPVYSPLYRTEVLRRVYRRFFTRSGRAFRSFTTGDIEVTWELVARLIELSYRCNLCRRCAQACPIGVDNGLIAREIRKVASQELGYAAKELHERGSVLQLKVGSSTGMNPDGFRKTVQFMEDDILERTGLKLKIPVDQKGADILLIHNAGEFLSWPENPEAFAIIFEAAGLSWTMSSEPLGYDAVNYGVWYDDAQFSRVALKHVGIAKKLGVKRIVVGECGHATKALVVTAERLLTGENYLPRESALPLLAELVKGGKLDLDPQRNDFPVTLHDPCNMVRLGGIVEPQREVLRRIAPGFREMEPHGVNNFCCGGGSGCAIMHSYNYDQVKYNVLSRMKVKQILDAFREELEQPVPKYVCAPCSNCKGELRDVLSYYGLDTKYNVRYGGLVDLIVNAMANIPRPFLELEQSGPASKALAK